ncbi:MAG: tRNA-dihydrouridine synthase family protein [Butyrivibrio sp.]|nr:tRNA-dihydrouridine synthase family protein [Butyrivibrio sp.]
MNYYFAPLEGITGFTYRNAHNKYFGGVDKYFIPFVAAHSSHNLKTREKEDIAPKNNIGINAVPQVLTNNADNFIWVVKEIADLGYKEVNFNLGCPAGTIVSKKRGSGFLAYPDELDAFFDKAFNGLCNVDIDISVKTRIGLHCADEAGRIFEIYDKYPISELIVHPRTRKQMYSGKPDMEAFAQIVRTSKHRICFNGNLCSVSDIDRFTKNFPQIDTVMMGRGLLADPALAIASKCANAENTSTLPMTSQSVENKGAGRNLFMNLKVLKAFHDDIYNEYLKTMPGDMVAVNRMKELWKYMGNLFESPDKAMKDIKKANTPAAYVSAVRVLFSSGKLSE